MFLRTPTLRLGGGGQAGSPVTSRRLLGLILVCAVCAVPLAWAQDSTGSREYQLKAALIYSFTKYIDWPPSRFASPDSPVVIGIIGQNPFGDELERVVEGRKVNGRGFLIKPIYSAKEIASVHVLFVPAGEEPRVVGNTMDLIQAPGVLTVGETDQFTVLGGIITFVTVEDKVHFEVSRDSAERGGVRIGQQLLKLSSHGRKKI